jgi:hypothetical protein
VGEALLAHLRRRPDHRLLRPPRVRLSESGRSTAGPPDQDGQTSPAA